MSKNIRLFFGLVIGLFPVFDIRLFVALPVKVPVKKEIFISIFNSQIMNDWIDMHFFTCVYRGLFTNKYFEMGKASS